MKILIFGGSGHIGSALKSYFQAKGHHVLVVGRKNTDLKWDGKTLGDWAKEVEGADVVINLNGKSVNCRMTDENFKLIMDTRVDSTRVVGQAIQQAENPPKLWLNASTSTFYKHRFDKPNDDVDGVLEDDPTLPKVWRQSLEVAQAWEDTFNQAVTPNTRKIAMRISMVMSNRPGGVYEVLTGLAKKFLGGTLGSGKQRVSWIHETDICRAAEFVIDREDLSGPINFCAPDPIPQKEFARIHRESLGVKIGLPATEWMLEIGCWAMKTESELVMKSRYVMPRRLLEAGFEFTYPTWQQAADNLAKR